VTDKRNRRSLNGTVVLRVLASVVKAKFAPCMSRGKPECRTAMVNETDYNIVTRSGPSTGASSSTTCSLFAGDVSAAPAALGAITRCGR